MFALRKQWFKLQAKNFIQRYSTGLMVIAIFLPGVAIGDNFRILMTAITTPFLSLSQNHHSFFQQAFYLLLLQAIFLVWARAQKQAINGGQFIQYIKTLPVKRSIIQKHDAMMLMISNHLLWPIIIYAFYLLVTPNHVLSMIQLLRFFYLIALLLLSQYISLFQPQKSYVIFTVIFNCGLLINTPQPLMWVCFLIFSLMSFAYLLYQKAIKIKMGGGIIRLNLLPGFLSHNLYYQMLFKANSTSVVFRLLLISSLLLGYFMASKHLNTISHGNVLPYIIALEALLAFYISGFFVMFRDERSKMSCILMSLPVNSMFWPVRDILATVILSLIIQSIFFGWLISFLNMGQVVLLFCYHLALLMLCYPLRKLKDDKQTLISFVVPFIITAVSIYHLT